MKLKITIVSFLLLAAYGILARATDNFNFYPPNDNEAYNTAPDGDGLLLPRLNDYSGKNRGATWNRRSHASYRSNNGGPVSGAGEISHRTAADSFASASDDSRPWVGVWIAVGGLTGAVVAVAIGQWRRSQRRRRRRAPLSAFLVATLGDNRQQIVKPTEFEEKTTKETRRAA